ncbi:Hypothetical predicted protein [Octopus vulgaris]|uniref:Uncharacterized protein n=1 Tax=Octopus vulgaris TaxID=6645 RepID=A0AA36B110_OCTVU|nr:Hypothetical predicted protein [Octopus vulgaris]
MKWAQRHEKSMVAAIVAMATDWLSMQTISLVTQGLLMYPAKKNIRKNKFLSPKIPQGINEEYARLKNDLIKICNISYITLK